VERIQKLKEYLQASPNDSFLQHALALEYIKLGNDEEARSLFEAILKREPGYVGSYYHLAKLLERTGETAAAIKICEKGMEESKKVADQLAYNELRGVYEDLVY
jgi:tetratricopeptide (TPR) repeat protein